MRNFKRSYLAVAVAAALGSGFAHAGVDLDDQTGVVYYGSETVVDDSHPAGGFSTGDGFFSFYHEMGSPPLGGGGGISHYLRYELSAGAEWPAAASIEVSTPCTNADIASKYPDSDDPSALIVVASRASGASSAGCNVTDKVYVTLTDGFNGSFSGKLVGTSNVSLTYKNYSSNGTGALQGTAPIGTSTQSPYIDFSKSFFVKSNVDVATSVIDVAQQSLVFETYSGNDNKTTAFCGFNLQDSDEARMPNGLFPSIENPATIDVVDSGANSPGSTTLVVSGDFSAVDVDGDNKTDDVFLAKNSNCTSPIPIAGAETTISTDATTATIEVGATNFPADAYVCMTVNGTDEIQPAEYSMQYSPTEASGDYSLNPLNFSCGEVKRGGSSAQVPLVLNPAGAAYADYIRISNPSNIDGNVHITAYTDDGGKSSTWTFMLAAGASTGLITPEMIQTETGVTPPGGAHDIGAGQKNKVRLVVNAEFGTNGTDSGVIVRSYTLSTSGDVFNAFQ